MRHWRIVIVLLITLVLIGTIGCNPFGSGEAETTEQLVEVVRGDLAVTVSGSGNIEVSNEANLAFGSGGKVAEIYVNEGDQVSPGNVIAKLDTSSLELALVQAQVTQTQAQLTLETAQYALEQTQALYPKPAEVSAAQLAVSGARQAVDYAELQLDKAITPYDIERWTKELKEAEENLRAAEFNLSKVLSTPDAEEVALKRLQVEVAQQSLELADKSLELAQKQLDEAIITAPFDGIIAKVYVEEGDIVSPPTMAPKTIAYLVDLTSMELEIEVDEIDIATVQPGQRAVIEVDALPDLKLEGKVSSISLVPKEASGVVVYDVKIELGIAAEAGLRVGMSATADIIIAERSDVLLVPDRAVTQDSQGNPVVEVMVNGQAEEREVVIGISDGFQTEIVVGLEEGEKVVERRSRSQPSGGLF